MTAKEFLRERNIIGENKNDLIIGFDNGRDESLVDLLNSYHERLTKDNKPRGINIYNKTLGFDNGL